MEKINWRTPIPLIINSESTAPAPYPIDSLPKEISTPVLSYQSYGQQPVALIACAALANISLACQTLANVARDSLLKSRHGSNTVNTFPDSEVLLQNSRRSKLAL